MRDQRSDRRFVGRSSFVEFGQVKAELHRIVETSVLWHELRSEQIEIDCSCYLEPGCSRPQRMTDGQSPLEQRLKTRFVDDMDVGATAAHRALGIEELPAVSACVVL